MSRAAYYREWNRANPEARRSHVLKYRYGISLEQYNEMLSAQGGGCAICCQVCPTGKALAVDHDGETGVVRGLLCRACNGAIGALGHDPEIIDRAAEYMRQWQSSNH